MIASIRPIRWRLVWTSLLALGLALGSFYLNQWVYAFSDDECWWKLEPARVGAQGKLEPPRVIIKEVLPDGVAEQAGILDGDELLAIQGRKVLATGDGLTAAQRQINDTLEGRILIYTVKREGETLHLPIRMVKPLDRTQLVRLVTGLLFWAVGLLVVASSPQRKTSRHFYYLGLLFLLAGSQSAGFVNTPPRWIQVAQGALGLVTGVLLGPLLFHFFLRFPHPFPLRRNRRFLLALYGTFALLGLVLTTGGMVQIFRPEIGSILGWKPGAPIPPALGATLFFTGRTFQVLTGVVVAGACVLFWVGTFRLAPRLRRAVVPVLLLTSAVVLDLVIFGILNVFLGNQGLTFRRQQWILLLPLPLMPLVFAYAVLRHGFFDVRRALARWVIYFVCLGLVLALYLGALALAFAHWLQNIPAGWAGALIGLLALPLGWILQRLLLFLRRRFRRDLGTAREIVTGALREHRNRLSEESLISGLKEALQEAFQPQLLLVLPARGQAIELPPLEDSGEGRSFQATMLEFPAPVLRHARDNRELVLGIGSDEAAWVQECGPGLRAHLDAMEAQVLVLILANQELHSAILLGGKYAELNYSREDRELLREVAIAAGIVIETAVLHRKLLDQGRLEQELHTARRIQETLTTTAFPEVPGFQLALRLEPAFETGGDLLWVKRRSDGRWLAAVGDVSGKGLAAALYMSQAIALLEFAMQHADHRLEDILVNLDQTLRNLLGVKDFLTLTLLEWDGAGRFRLARAGHPPALLIRGGQEGDTRELCPHGRGLGLRPQGINDWEVVEGTLDSRQWLVLYSDGLTEAMNKKGELYGAGRVASLLQRVWGTGSVRAASEALFRDVASFEAQNRDDRTLLILARDPA
ncbi:MAG: SpoIIE family protein phosphatase [Acidobacteria bacterium]|nr:SpoIIE family protein phosphatase [Acidobacteriota bacterium]